MTSIHPEASTRADVDSMIAQGIDAGSAAHCIDQACGCHHWTRRGVNLPLDVHFLNS